MADLTSAKSWIMVVMELAIAFAMYPVIVSLLAEANISGTAGVLVSALIPLILVLAILWRAYEKLF
jgi:hypothetical protein